MRLSCHTDSSVHAPTLSERKDEARLVSTPPTTAAITSAKKAACLVVLCAVLLLGVAPAFAQSTVAVRSGGLTVDQASADTVRLSDDLSATDSVDVRSGENVTGLGAQITSDADLGTTVITRGHAPQSGTSTDESIARYYDIQPGVNSGLDAKLEFYYDNAELNGRAAGTLELWRSDDGGATYVHAGGASVPSARVVVLNGIDSFSRWTAAGSDEPPPVELSLFEASRSSDGVDLIWATLSKTNSASFEVQRAEVVPSDSSAALWSTVGHLEAAGTTDEAQTYCFSDADLPYTAETLRYRLKQVDIDGSSTYEGEAEVALDTPDAFALHGNYPNPLRDQTTIRYELPKAAKVRFAIYDVLGRRVKVLVDEQQPAGRKELRFEAANLPSGSYFYRLQAEDQVETRRLTVVR